MTRLNRRAVLAGIAAAPLSAHLAHGQQRSDGSGQGVAVNLAPITDWSTEQPFINVFKTARRWIGHLPGQWGGRDFAALEAGGILDAQGWPTRLPRDLGSIGTVILNDLPEKATALAGRYVLRFAGEGIVEVAGSARNVRYGDGEVSFDFVPGLGLVDIRIQRTDPDGSGDYIRNISVVREDLQALHEAGERFRPDWLNAMSRMKGLRFMDWMNTNDSAASEWENRARVDDFSYTRQGAPLEVMMALAAETGAEPWFCVPHLADDSYVRAMAEAVHSLLSGLPEGMRVHVEFSNEVWNWQFAQAEWADAQALELWGVADSGAQFHGLRASEVARIWSDAFGADRARLVNVIATQTGWLGLEGEILTAPLAQEDGWPAPVEAFDAYAVTGYFGHFLGTDEWRARIAEWLEESRESAAEAGRAAGVKGEPLKANIAAHGLDDATRRAASELSSGAESDEEADTIADLVQRIFPYHAEVAERHGLALTMYEGGSHVVGLGAQVEDDALTGFFLHLNYSPEMGALYGDLMDSWAALGAGPFNQFNDVSAPGKWGSWGAMRWPGDENPRWRAIEARM